MELKKIIWNIDDWRVRQTLVEVAKNDGLEIEDFRRWFFPDKLKTDEYLEAAIIHFTPFRYE